MRELELELRALAADVELPPAPDLTGPVLARIREEARPALAWRRTLAIAFAVLVVAAGAAMAVPQARSAVLEWLGLRGVAIERVPERPKARPGADLALGDPVTLGEARRRAAFRVRVPAGELARPSAVYFSDAQISGGYVAFVYGTEARVRLLITQFRARIEEEFVHKLLGPGTRVERVAVNGRRGFWIEGEPHEVLFLDRNGNPVADAQRLAGNTLVWEAGDGVTLRLEGNVGREEALGIARSLR